MEKVFCTPPILAKITGLDVREIRRMCELKIIPNELTDKGRYRILRDKALRILTKRAESFEGHFREEQSSVMEAIRRRREAESSKKLSKAGQKHLDRMRYLARRGGS